MRYLILLFCLLGAAAGSGQDVGQGFTPITVPDEVVNVDSYESLATVPESEKIAVVGLHNGGVFRRDPNAITPDGGIVPVAGWKRVFNGPIDLGWYKVSTNYESSDMETNTTIISNVIQNNPGETYRIPPGCVYNWVDIHDELPDYTKIIDDSGYDYTNSGSNDRQSYTRVINRTTENTGATNGNTFWLTGGYHPAYMIQNLGEINTTDARASLVMWQRDEGDLYKVGTQFGQEFTEEGEYWNRLIQYHRYTENGELFNGKSVLNIRHALDTINAGATGFNVDPDLGASYDFGLAGMRSSNGFYAKNLIRYQTLPETSVGGFIDIWRVGTGGNSDVYFRRNIFPSLNEIQYVYNTSGLSKSEFYTGTKIVTEDSTGARYGARIKVVDMVASNANIGNTYSKAFYTNANNTAGGVAKNLPPATRGLELSFVSRNPTTFRLVPASGDRYVDRPAGEWMQTNETGATIFLFCVEDGVWHFRRTGHWTNQTANGYSERDMKGEEVFNSANGTTPTSLTTLQQVEDAISAKIRSGTGSPEGALTAPPGTLYLNTLGGANTTLYVKESGTGNTGWVAK